MVVLLVLHFLGPQGHTCDKNVMKFISKSILNMLSDIKYHFNSIQLICSIVILGQTGRGVKWFLLLIYKIANVIIYLQTNSLSRIHHMNECHSFISNIKEI